MSRQQRGRDWSPRPCLSTSTTGTVSDCYPRALASWSHAASQRRHASAQIRQCSCMLAWLSQSAAQARQAVLHAWTSALVRLASEPAWRRGPCRLSRRQLHNPGPYGCTGPVRTPCARRGSVRTCRAGLCTVETRLNAFGQLREIKLTPVLRVGLQHLQHMRHGDLLRRSSPERPVNGWPVDHAATFLRRLFLVSWVLAGGGSSPSSLRSKASWWRSRSLTDTRHQRSAARIMVA